MKPQIQTRVLAIALAVATLAACVLAGFNFVSEAHYLLPSDGTWWVETAQGLRAERVPAESPAGRAGIHRGDLLQAINDHPTHSSASRVREIFRTGVWGHASYSILRPVKLSSSTAAPRSPPKDAASPAAARFDVQLILEPADRTSNLGSRLIALVYLLIGLYVLFRRWTAPKSLHFYIFCLVSFVLYSFKYTGELGLLDWTIYWCNTAAAALQPALFLHFAVSFSDPVRSASDPVLESRHRRSRILLAALIYLPGFLLVALQYAAIEFLSATEALRHRLEQLSLGYLTLYYVIAALVFWTRTQRANSPLQRQQLKWLTRGTVIAVTPFTLLYVIPFLADISVPGWLTKVAGLSLVFLPLTFSWAIVRYRLMDVDLIFKRGVTYTLATAALVGLYFSSVALAATVVHSRLPILRNWGLLVAIAVTALLFDPLKRAIQARVDRMFEQKRFDYKETLVEFGRRLNALTDLGDLVDSIVERLPQTLLVTRVAVFLAAEDTERPGSASISPGATFRLAASHGLLNLQPAELATLNLSFFNFDSADATSHVFLDNPQQVLRFSPEHRRAVSRLDLNYYLPCRVADREGHGTRTVAVIGLGRTSDGDFLSSEDMELLESLAGYIGIAIQNAQLYRRLEQKINDFERLKEFNENIVESIDIGIFAVDLNDCIDSWNTRMEAMFDRPRNQALRQPLASVFPPEFLAAFDSVRSQTAGPDLQGTHTLYKFRLPLPNGETRVANIAIAPLMTRDLLSVGRIILVDDITDRIQLEDQLTQAEKLSSIGLLAAGVAHEVNTPLAVISSYAQMLTKQLRSNSDDQAYGRMSPVLEKITQQTFRASEIVNGLLNFSRISATEYTSLDLNEITRDTLNLLDHQMRTARIRVTTNFSPSLARVQGNQGKIQQVLLNFLLNAKDAMHTAALHTDSAAPTRESILEVSSENTPGAVVIRIQDSGSGIEPAHLQRIYDPFFTTKNKPDDSDPTARKGTGLGLAISYGIMQEHAGKILVESEVGIGTTFRLVFPAAGIAALTLHRPSEEHPAETSLHAQDQSRDTIHA